MHTPGRACTLRKVVDYPALLKTKQYCLLIKRKALLLSSAIKSAAGESEQCKKIQEKLGYPSFLIDQAAAEGELLRTNTHVVEKSGG